MHKPQWIIVVGTVLLSCVPKTISEPPRQGFFALEEFLQKLAADSTQVSVTKKIVINDHEETKEFSRYPFYEDLAAFTNYDIARPALYDKYDVDSTFSEGGLMVYYQALDTTLKVRSMMVVLEKDEVKRLEINAITESFLEDATVSISILPESGYTLRRTSHKIFEDPRSQLVEVRINK